MAGKRGRPGKLGETEQRILREIVTERPHQSLAQIGSELATRTGIQAHEATIRNALRAAGVKRLRGKEGVRIEPHGEVRRYGYSEAHRRTGPEDGYPSSLTDAEWERVADLFGWAGVAAAHPASRPGRCLLLRRAYGVCLEDVAAGVSALGQRLQDLSALERAGEI